MLANLFLFVIFVLALAVLPFWPYSKGWGFIPSILLYVVWVVVFMLVIAEVF
jgi:Protein of unknown function (DUF3309)